jgi:hypothetical protein
MLLVDTNIPIDALEDSRAMPAATASTSLPPVELIASSDV